MKYIWYIALSRRKKKEWKFCEEHIKVHKNEARAERKKEGRKFFSNTVCINIKYVSISWIEKAIKLHNSNKHELLLRVYILQCQYLWYEFSIVEVAILLLIFFVNW